MLYIDAKIAIIMNRAPLLTSLILTLCHKSITLAARGLEEPRYW